MIGALLFLIYSLVIFVAGIGFGAMAVIANMGDQEEPESLLPSRSHLQLVVDNTPMDAA